MGFYYPCRVKSASFWKLFWILFKIWRWWWQCRKEQLSVLGPRVKARQGAVGRWRVGSPTTSTSPCSHKFTLTQWAQWARLKLTHTHLAHPPLHLYSAHQVQLTSHSPPISTTQGHSNSPITIFSQLTWGVIYESIHHTWSNWPLVILKSLL